MEMPDVQIIYTVNLGDDGVLKMITPPTECQYAEDIYHHSRVVEALQKESEENCRLLGMSAERELALLAEIDRLKAKLAKTEWRPIESAPHGIWILIFAYENVCQACWDSNGYWSTFRENRIQPIAATHWMPLPEPPTTEETKCLK